MHLHSPATILAGAALLLTGCVDWDHGSTSRFREDFNISQAFKAGGELNIENTNGSIEIAGWDRDEIEINGQKYANTEEKLKAVRIDVANSASGIRIRTIGPSSGNWSNWGAKYIIKLPKKVILDRVVSSNGSIRVSSIDGRARLRTSNGSIRILNLLGDVELETSNASIELDDHEGSVIAKTSNGSIRADNVKGRFDAETSNSSIQAVVSDPQPGKPVRAASSNGSIKLTMKELRGNDINLKTSNSSIVLNLPTSAKANLIADTSHSSVQCELPIDIKRGELGKDNVEGALNGGGPTRLELNTSNGSIKIQRAD